ncbi:MAG: FkbM family methyltransferase [Parcubacteria group bacterium]|nr:FkbM family methyltransferase [Parcubacteria group bacterium]
MSTLNTIKKSLFHTYALYEAHTPVHLGAYQVAKALNALFGLAVFTISGFKIELNPIAVIDRTLILGLSHDDVVAASIREMKEGTFLDIGANIGYFSLMAASLGRNVIAFEPSKREVDRMERNIRLNGFSSIRLISEGISDKKEELVLHLGQEFNPGQNSVVDVVNSKESEMTSYAPLTSFLSEEELRGIRLCKIDVEGFELNVLLGMEECMPLLARSSFVIEITPKFLAKAGHSANDIYAFFEKYGFEPRFGLDSSARKYDEVFVPRTR